jgi:hypothetical protein
MTQPGTDPFPPSIETPTAQLYGTVALLFGALVRQTELTAALKRTKADNARLREESNTIKAGLNQFLEDNEEEFDMDIVADLQRIVAGVSDKDDIPEPVTGAAPVTVQEAARVLLAREAQKSVYDACSGVVKVYRFNAVLQSLSALVQKEYSHE